MKRIEERRLNRAWSAAVRNRDRHMCRRCFGMPVEPHHIFTSSRRSTRWDLVNGIALCRSCHRWIHAHPADGMIWLTHVLGEATLEALQLKSRQRAKFTSEERDEMLAALLEGGK